MKGVSASVSNYRRPCNLVSPKVHEFVILGHGPRYFKLKFNSLIN